MMLYGRVVRMQSSNLQRQAALNPESAEPAVWKEKRCRGRPRQLWTTSVYEHVLSAFGEAADGAALLTATPAEWGEKVSNYIAAMAAEADGE